MQCQKLKTYMETGRVMFLPARAIRPNPAQPRKVFREEALSELADSIRQHGILQPLSVRRTGTGYELIAGERRLRAAQLANLNVCPPLHLAIGNHLHTGLPDCGICRHRIQFHVRSLHRYRHLVLRRHLRGLGSYCGTDGWLPHLPRKYPFLQTGSV